WSGLSAQKNGRGCRSPFRDVDGSASRADRRVACLAHRFEVAEGRGPPGLDWNSVVGCGGGGAAPHAGGAIFEKALAVPSVLSSVVLASRHRPGPLGVVDLRVFIGGILPVEGLGS